MALSAGIGRCGSGRNGPLTELGANVIHGVLQAGEFFSLLAAFNTHEIELRTDIGFVSEIEGGDGERADRSVHIPTASGQIKCSLPDLAAQVGGGGQLLLTADIPKIRIADGQRNTTAFHVVLAQPKGYLIGQHGYPCSDFFLTEKISGKGSAVAHRFRGCVLTCRSDRGVVQTVGEVMQLPAVFSQQGAQRITVEVGQISDGPNAVAAKDILRRMAHIQ